MCFENKLGEGSKNNATDMLSWHKNCDFLSKNAKNENKKNAEIMHDCFQNEF